MKGLLPKIPAFEWSIEQIDESLKAQMQESGSWKPGVPISFDELRLIHVSFWGFDAKPHTGRLVVNSRLGRGTLHRLPRALRGALPPSGA